MDGEGRRRRNQKRTERGLSTSGSLGANGVNQILAGSGSGNVETDEKFAQLQTAYREYQAFEQIFKELKMEVEGFVNQVKEMCEAGRKMGNWFSNLSVKLGFSKSENISMAWTSVFPVIKEMSDEIIGLLDQALDIADDTAMMFVDFEDRKKRFTHYCTKLQGLREKAENAERKGQEGPSDEYIKANEKKKSNARSKMETSMSALAHRLGNLMEDWSSILNTCTALFVIAHSKWSNSMSKPVEEFLNSSERGKDSYSNWKRVNYAASGVGGIKGSAFLQKYFDEKNEEEVEIKRQEAHKIREAIGMDGEELASSEKLIAKLKKAEEGAKDVVRVNDQQKNRLKKSSQAFHKITMSMGLQGSTIDTSGPNASTISSDDRLECEAFSSEGGMNSSENGATDGSNSIDDDMKRESETPSPISSSSPYPSTVMSFRASQERARQTVVFPCEEGNQLRSALKDAEEAQEALYTEIRTAGQRGHALASLWKVCEDIVLWHKSTMKSMVDSSGSESNVVPIDHTEITKEATHFESRIQKPADAIFFIARAVSKIHEARSFEDGKNGDKPFVEVMDARREMVRKQFGQASTSIKNLNQLLIRNQMRTGGIMDGLVYLERALFEPIDVDNEDRGMNRAESLSSIPYPHNEGPSPREGSEEAAIGINRNRSGGISLLHSCPNSPEMSPEADIEDAVTLPEQNSMKEANPDSLEPNELPEEEEQEATGSRRLFRTTTEAWQNLQVENQAQFSVACDASDSSPPSPENLSASPTSTVHSAYHSGDIQICSPTMNRHDTHDTLSSDGSVRQGDSAPLSPSSKDLA